MSEPSSKHPSIDAMLTAVFGVNRAEAINADRCVEPPVGCGQPISSFKDGLARKEYLISGLCQSCQDKVFKDFENMKGGDK
jgi:hypothetical protein